MIEERVTEGGGGARGVCAANRLGEALGACQALRGARAALLTHISLFAYGAGASELSAQHRVSPGQLVYRREQQSVVRPIVPGSLSSSKQAILRVRPPPQPDLRQRARLARCDLV